MTSANGWLYFMLVSLAASGSALAQEKKTLDKSTRAPTVMKVELLGASIGRQWRLDEFAQRTNRHEFKLSARQEYDFDKGRLLREVLAEKDRPDAVIIKECAAYFPGDVAKYQTMTDSWVVELRKAGIRPVLATSSPVTERLPTWTYAKQLIKRYILRRDYVDNDKRLRDVWTYNDFVRRYAAENKIPLLDIERAVRISDQNRALRPEFTSGDGLHLNATAYQALDRALEETLIDLNKKR